MKNRMEMLHCYHNIRFWSKRSVSILSSKVFTNCKKTFKVSALHFKICIILVFPAIQCSNKPCKMGTCSDTGSGFECECPKYFGGKTCEVEEVFKYSINISDI